MKRALLLIAALLQFSGSLFAQNARAAAHKNFNIFSRLLSPEKIYLQTDRDIYCVGDTIRIKGYLLDNSYIAEYPECNYIYAEIVASSVGKNSFTQVVEKQENIVARAKIKRSGGIFSGYLVLPNDLNTGICILRGYSYWMLNSDPAYIFFKNIKVTNPMKDDLVSDMMDKGVKENSQYNKIGVENPFSKKKEGKAIDLQFMPEGGRLVAGMQNCVAFKAVGEDGLGRSVSGEVYDASGNTICEIRSNDLGMGKFYINPSDTKGRYYAVVSDEEGTDAKAKLPKAETTGVALDLVNKDGNITVAMERSADLGGDSLFVFVCNGTEIFYRESFEGEMMRFHMKEMLLMPGINNIFVTDSKLRIIADRPFFVMPYNSTLVKIIPDKKTYSKRDRVECTISLVTPYGRPLTGDYAVSVTDDRLAPCDTASNNIISYMLLNSELKGIVEEPSHYTDPDIDINVRRRDADLLMLAQGWKYYDLAAVISARNKIPYFGKEYVQTLSGKVYGIFGKKGKSLVSFVAPSIRFSALGQVDSGYFELKDISFPEGTEFIVSSVNKHGRGIRFNPVLDEDMFAPMFKYPVYNKKVAYSQTYGQLAKNNYYKSGGETVYQLNPIYITDRYVTPSHNPSPFWNQRFRREQIREGKELEAYKDYDIITYITTTCSGLRMDYDTLGQKIIKCHVPFISSRMAISDGWEPIVVYINGMEYPFSELEGMTMDDVLSFAYFKGMEAAPYQTASRGADYPLSVVLLKTKRAAGAKMPSNVTAGKPLGWQQPVKFYEPVYEADSSLVGCFGGTGAYSGCGVKYFTGDAEGGKDMRPTLFWCPALTFSGDGKARIVFYTSDDYTGFTIRVEGVSSDGSYGAAGLNVERSSR
ncbi:MAG: hypothetical protein LKI53_09570 [Bacteroidales bacterium]|jgi:hypothetical protein|nr:hypothetical protein [Bacteroidales bacterium]